MSKKHKKVCMVLYYAEHFLILDLRSQAVLQVSAFSFLLGISIGITSSATGLKICTITSGIKKY